MYSFYPWFFRKYTGTISAENPLKHLVLGKYKETIAKKKKLPSQIKEFSLVRFLLIIPLIYHWSGYQLFEITSDYIFFSSVQLYHENKTARTIFKLTLLVKTNKVYSNLLLKCSGIEFDRIPACKGRVYLLLWSNSIYERPVQYKS